MLPRRPRRKMMRKRRVVRRKPVLRRRGKRSTNVPDIAKCSVKRTILGQGGNPFVINTLYDVHNVALQDYDRAVTIAKAYQYFRIKKIAVTIKYQYDTFQAGAGAASRPNLYFMLDKSQSIPANVTLEALKQMGARPFQVDNKPFTIKWSPSVLTEDQTPAGPVPSQYKISPWLNTNAANLGNFVPSQVQHNGLYWYMNQEANGGVNYQYSAEIEVQFEFKKPLWTAIQGAPNSQSITYAVLDNSSDGVVGGDGNLNKILPGV